MKLPPPGYDDPFVVPQKRMLALIDQFEEKLSAVQKVFDQQLLHQTHISEDLQEQSLILQHTADELSPQHQVMVKEILETFEAFKHKPDRKKLLHIKEKIETFRKFLIS